MAGLATHFEHQELFAMTLTRRVELTGDWTEYIGYCSALKSKNPVKVLPLWPCAQVNFGAQYQSMERQLENISR
jgi:hypothetical protein